LLKNLKLINKNQLVHFIYNENSIRGVICDIAKKNILDYFNHKLIVIVKAYSLIYYKKKIYADNKKIIGYDIQANFLILFITGTYIYKKKDLNSNI